MTFGEPFQDSGEALAGIERVVSACDPFHPRFFDEHLGSAVGAFDYVIGSGNKLLT